MDGRSDVITDTSTLINFLKVDRTDLLTENPRYRFVVTEHVRSEVTGAYPQVFERLQVALESGGIVETLVTDLNELALFATLRSTHRLGLGECASIAAAHIRCLALALDDRQAANRARQLNPPPTILNTQELMLQLIQDDVLDIVQADVIKQEWESQHSFRLRIASFGELL